MSLPFADVWIEMDRAAPLLPSTRVGTVAAAAAAPFDYDPNTPAGFRPWARPDLPGEGIGAIVGASGSGKSLLLAEFGDVLIPQWGDACVADHFDSAEAASSALYAAGLSSVPTWLKPYSVLSNGERFRADLARVLARGSGLVDEFTSVVDRTVARSASIALRRHVTREGGTFVLATCHRDVLPWLQPDWVIDTDDGAYALKPRECLQRPTLVADVFEVDRAMWAHFMGHHYLSESLHPFARCYLATVDGAPVAFGAAIPFPHGHIANAWRGTRTVTLPDYQGMGLGVRLSDWIAEAHVRAGYRYFSRTTHPRMGEYREQSPAWRATSNNRKVQKPPDGGGWGRVGRDATRIAYSHEFVGVA